MVPYRPIYKKTSKVSSNARNSDNSKVGDEKKEFRFFLKTMQRE
jgi:hypothetical protein